MSGSWVYIDLPEPLTLPPCKHCGNRGRTSQFAPFAFFCGDCGKAFGAVWRNEKAVPSTVRPARKALAS